MISGRQVKACIDRLRILPIRSEYQQDPDTIAQIQAEAAKQIMINCSTLDAAERLTQRLIEGCRYFPMPSEIADYATQSRNSGPIGAQGCPHCGGTGFSPAFGVPSGKGVLQRLDVEQLRVELGEDGWYNRNGVRVPCPPREVVAKWGRLHGREVHEVAENCMCRNAAMGAVA